MAAGAFNECAQLRAAFGCIALVLVVSALFVFVSAAPFVELEVVLVEEPVPFVDSAPVDSLGVAVLLVVPAVPAGVPVFVPALVLVALAL